MDKRLAQLAGPRPGRNAGADRRASTPDAVDATVPFEKNVYLIPTPEFRTGRKSYPVAYGCLDPDQAQALTPAIKDAISARPNLMRAELPVSSLSSLLVVYDDQYVMVAGDCLERVMYDLETNQSRSRDEFEVTQIVAARHAPAIADAPASTSATPKTVRFKKTAEPVTRL